MKLLTFQARRFAWKAFSQTLAEATPDTVQDCIEGEFAETVVVFVHAQSADEDPERRAKVFKQSLKHIKWLAGKRDFRRVVLHSFTHLGGENASAEFAREFLEDLDERLTKTDYEVARTPFGWFCEWELSVYGESLAKVWKEIG